MKLHSSKILALGTILSFAVAGCGSDSDGDPVVAVEEPADGSVLDATKPSDSTGKSVSMSLALGSVSTSAASLALEDAGASEAMFATAPTSVQVDANLLVTDARMSIAAIKVKSEKEASKLEKAIEEKMRKRDAERAKKEAAEDAADEKELAVEEEKLMLTAPEGAEKSKEVKATVAKKRAEKKAKRAKERMAKDDKDTKDDEAADKNLRHKGPFVYDLVKGTASPALPEVKLLDGSYRRIHFQLKPNRTLESTDTLLNNTFTISGQAKVSGADVPFRISYHVAENVRLASDKGVKLDAEANPVAIAFDMKSWFKGIDFSKATKDASGVIVIDKKANKEALRVFRKNLKASTRFGKDSGKDGKITEAEAVGDGAAAASETDVAGE